MATINLGKKYKVGETFTTSTKRMDKRRNFNCLKESQGKPASTYEVLKQGEIRMFEKGRRKYLCEVQGMVEYRTGLKTWSLKEQVLNKRFTPHYRWWQFTYLVKIIEN